MKGNHEQKALFESETLRSFLRVPSSVVETFRIMSQMKGVKQFLAELDGLCLAFETQEHPDVFEARASLMKEMRSRVTGFLESLKALNILEPMSPETFAALTPAVLRCSHETHWNLADAYGSGLAVEPSTNAKKMSVFQRRRNTVRDVNVVLGRVVEKEETHTREFVATRRFIGNPDFRPSEFERTVFGYGVGRPVSMKREEVRSPEVT